MNRLTRFCYVSGKTLRDFSVIILGVLAVPIFGSSVSNGQTNTGLLPIFTSPIDITGLSLKLRAIAPDRDSGVLVDVPFPSGFLGPRMKQLMSAPLSVQFDQFWTTPDPVTGLSPQNRACNDPQGIVQNVRKAIAGIGSSYSAYDISCNLSSTGRVLAQRSGSGIALAYQLTNNTVSFASTSPVTCRPENGSAFCPNDPRFTVNFAIQVVTAVRAPGLCQLDGEDGTVYALSPYIEPKNAAAEVARFLFGGTLFNFNGPAQTFTAAEAAISNTQRNQPLPLDTAFAELRTSPACAGENIVARVFSAFRQADVEVSPREGITLSATHVGIATPTLSIPNPGGGLITNWNCCGPQFGGPAISALEPLIRAGSATQLSGQRFPLNINWATELPVSLRHGGYGKDSENLNGRVCSGGMTELVKIQFGLPFQTVAQLPGDGDGKCKEIYTADGLLPVTPYRFVARDCDAVTCSRWSPPTDIITAIYAPEDFTVTLSLDDGKSLGTAVVNSQGIFNTPITIPADTPIGTHSILATKGDAKASTAIEVAASSPTGSGPALMMVVGRLPGESGCPNHPISGTATDAPFALFGAGFAPGTVEVRLDNVAGPQLGTATARPDGSFCQQILAPSQPGARTLMAVQGSAVLAQTGITFNLPVLLR
jgi:hypothetical protein